MPKRLQPLYTEEGQRQRQARRRKARTRYRVQDRDDEMAYVDYIDQYQPPHNNQKGSYGK